MPAPFPRHPDIHYWELLPGFLGFDCQRLRATLSPTSCAEQWRHPRDGSPCNGCPVGAHHAGKPSAPPKPIRPPCLRCGRSDGRLLAKVLCVGCYNRAREAVKGRNGKGSRPKLAPAKLRQAHAILHLPDAAKALDRLYRRRDTSRHWKTAFHRDHKPGLPLLQWLDADHAWMDVVSTGEAEIHAMGRRLLPGAEVVEIELGPTFLERWEAVPASVVTAP